MKIVANMFGVTVFKKTRCTQQTLTTIGRTYVSHVAVFFLGKIARENFRHFFLLFIVGKDQGR